VGLGLVNVACDFRQVLVLNSQSCIQHRESLRVLYEQFELCVLILQLFDLNKAFVDLCLCLSPLILESLLKLILRKDPLVKL
jgi:hypothetical protein